jgi:hypothetical protein
VSYRYEIWTPPIEAVERLLTGKLAGILTYFQRKINKNRHLILDARYQMLDTGCDKDAKGQRHIGKEEIRESEHQVAGHQENRVSGKDVLRGKFCRPLRNSLRHVKRGVSSWIYRRCGRKTASLSSENLPAVCVAGNLSCKTKFL